MPSPRHVILLIADSLRYDSVYRNNDILLPYLESNAVQFLQARSSGCWTLPATSSLFTGLMPHQHGATAQSRYIRADVTTLAEQMKAAGYFTYQVTANIATTDVFGLHRGFDEVIKIWQRVPAKFTRLQQFLVMLSKPRMRRMILSKDMITNKLTEDVEMSKTWLQLTHQDVFDEARRLIEHHEARGERCFLFLNLMESHFPYHVAPTLSMTSRFWVNKLRETIALFHTANQTFLSTGRLMVKPEMLKVLRERQRISWQILAPAINSFVQEMHENTGNLVIFGSDHGDNFGDQGWLYHFSNVTDGGNKVPFMWLSHDGSTKPSKIETEINTKDVYHSILTACGMMDGPTIVEEPEESISVMQSYWYNKDGRTLPRYRYNQICFVEHGHRYLYRSGRWLWAPASKDGGREPEFEPLPDNTNPLHESLRHLTRRKHLLQIWEDFKVFSDKIGVGHATVAH